MRVIFLFKVIKKPKRQSHRDGRRAARTCVLVCGNIANASCFSTKLAQMNFDKIGDWNWLACKPIYPPFHVRGQNIWAAASRDCSCLATEVGRTTQANG